MPADTNGEATSLRRAAFVPHELPFLPPWKCYEARLRECFGCPFHSISSLHFSSHTSIQLTTPRSATRCRMGGHFLGASGCVFSEGGRRRTELYIVCGVVFPFPLDPAHVARFLEFAPAAFTDRELYLLVPASVSSSVGSFPWECLPMDLPPRLPGRVVFTLRMVQEERIWYIVHGDNFRIVHMYNVGGTGEQRNVAAQVTGGFVNRIARKGRTRPSAPGPDFCTSRKGKYENRGEAAGTLLK